MGEVLGRKIADLTAAEPEGDIGKGPAGQVHHGPRQRLVERRVGKAKAPDASPVAEGLVQGRPEHQPGVLGRVWSSTSRSPLQVRLRSKPACLEREMSMWSRNPMPVGHISPPLAVQVERQRDPGLLGGPLDAGFSLFHGSSSSN